MKRSVARRSTVAVWAVVVSVGPWLAGCGTAGIGRVQGRVTVDGQPAPEGITIEFVPALPGELGNSIAVVGSNGEYVARNPATGEDGVVIGVCVARLVEDEKTTAVPQKQGQAPKPKYDPKAFKELHRFEVKSGSNTVDLELPAAGT